MTKARRPVTSAQAITVIAGLLGWQECARICDRSERMVRDWSDPDTGTAPGFVQCVLLDAAYIAAGGNNAPLFETYSLLLDRETAIACADAEALASATATAAKEAGEAIAALVTASRPGAKAHDRVRAAGETEEAIAALTANLNMLGKGGNA